MAAKGFADLAWTERGGASGCGAAALCQSGVLNVAFGAPDPGACLSDAPKLATTDYTGTTQRRIGRRGENGARGISRGIIRNTCPIVPVTSRDAAQVDPDITAVPSGQRPQGSLGDAQVAAQCGTY